MLLSVTSLQEMVLGLATSRRVQVEDSCALQDPTVGHTIGRIRDKIAFQLSLARKVQLIDVRVPVCSCVCCVCCVPVCSCVCCV